MLYAFSLIKAYFIDPKIQIIEKSTVYCDNAIQIAAVTIIISYKPPSYMPSSPLGSKSPALDSDHDMHFISRCSYYYFVVYFNEVC